MDGSGTLKNIALMFFLYLLSLKFLKNSRSNITSSQRLTKMPMARQLKLKMIQQVSKELVKKLESTLNSWLKNLKVWNLENRRTKTKWKKLKPLLGNRKYFFIKWPIWLGIQEKWKRTSSKVMCATSLAPMYLHLKCLSKQATTPSSWVIFCGITLRMAYLPIGRKSSKNENSCYLTMRKFLCNNLQFKTYFRPNGKILSRL